jgi:ABC-2 type transport system ATP-binding protein
MTPELQIDDLVLERGGRRVVDRVSFRMSPGEIVAVIGANGAGKTSLLETVVGFHHPSEGSIRYAGRTLERIRDYASVFAYMPDDALLPDEVRVSVLLETADRFGGVSRDFRRTVREALELGPLVSAHAGELSRGEKRRVSLYAALATSRPMIVLDEPLGTFDPLQLASVRELLKSRTREGRGLLLSVHQMSDAEKIADRVLILDRGRVLAFGPLAQLRDRAGAPKAPLDDVFLRLLEKRAAIRGGP